MTTPNEVVQFFYRSFCDFKVTGFDLTVTTDYLASTLDFAIDRDRSTAALTSGFDSDATPADFIIDFLTLRNIDTIAVRSNFKDFTIYYSVNGDSWSTFQSYSGSAVSFVIKTISAPISARYVKVVCTATITANQEKQLFQIDVTQSIGSLPVSSMQNPEQTYTRINAKNLKGGSIQLVLFPQFGKIGIGLNFKNLTSLYALYETIKTQFMVDACLVFIYYSDQISQIGYDSLYLMNDVLDKKFPPSANVIITGADGAMSLMEC